MESVLEELQDWYVANCDGEWEHQYGVKIETIDNPGWLVKIDLRGTPLERIPFKPVRFGAAPEKWMECSVDNAVFEGACGPEMLEEMVWVFLRWSDFVS